MKVVQRLVAVGLSAALAERLEALVQKWAERSGPEWTVNRLKSLKVELLNRLAGRQQVVPWVARNSSGLPKGPISEIFRLAEKGGRGRFIAINSLMVYSSFLSEKVTEKQREKFFSSMESKDRTGSQVVVRFQTPRVSGGSVSRGLPWVNASLSSESFQPGPDGKSYPETDSFVALVSAVCSKPIMHCVRKYTDLFKEVVPVAVMQDMRREGTVEIKYSTSPVNLAVGKISYIQEPGFKLRAVANPNRVLQAALEPLKEVLGRAVRQLPNDFTFDQDAGVQRVQGWLKEGKIVHSIDLSDATNLFPLEYTISALRQRVDVDPGGGDRYQRLISLFHEVSTSPWFAKESGEVSLHSFTRGQPLGLGPSFFAFGFSHNILLTDLCRSYRIPEGNFAVLGDDVCISHEKLAVEYRKSLDLLGCKISETKSLISQTVAEFAGKVIFRDDIVPQYKWRDVSDANVIDFCRNVGPKSLSLLTPRQRRLVSVLGPVPDLLGGLGWNPDGLPLDIRLLEPICQFLMESDITVILPYRRVDTPLKAFAFDNRVREISPLYISVNSGSVLFPSREEKHPQWGTYSFWLRFYAAGELSNVLPDHLVAEDSPEKEIPWIREDGNLEYFYSPAVKQDGGRPRKRETPWFDLVRYFERNQSRLIGNHELR